MEEVVSTLHRLRRKWHSQNHLRREPQWIQASHGSVASKASFHSHARTGKITVASVEHQTK